VWCFGSSYLLKLQVEEEKKETVKRKRREEIDLKAMAE
jgi:hypothetical protein